MPSRPSADGDRRGLRADPPAEPAPGGGQSLAKRIRDEIAANGPMSLARFMELALYHPEHGYYTRADRPIGRTGDFYTSVSVGRLFGELLARRFATWLDRLAGPVQIIEAGAHDGRLAADILVALDRIAPALRSRTEYWILEPLARRREGQVQTLATWANRVRWFADWREIAIPVQGVIFGNELLDAMPVHRWSWDAARGGWQAIGVGLDGDHFTWVPLAQPGDGASHPEFPAELADVLPDGYVIETSPAAESWWHAAAEALEHGWLLAIDYGHDTPDRWSPARTGGTFRGYRGHRESPDPLAHPGEQDLTAHVDFGAIRRAGERAGLQTEVFCSQEQFLTTVLSELSRDAAAMAAWSAPERRQLMTLLHPQHFGRAFRVLVQRR
ncbi:MAG: SAM-dependent methyltransferase [Verrucomicrobia bacterium]|nr:SAM-dependent methyltransferase [Verrucomicrobiota bacterium]